MHWFSALVLVTVCTVAISAPAPGPLSLSSHPILHTRVDVIQHSTFSFHCPGIADAFSIRLTQLVSARPIQLAAESLDEFYALAAVAISTFIGRDLDQDYHDFTLRLGNVVLDVYCRDYICWTVLDRFLEEMQRLTANGGPLVGYEGHVVNTVTQYTMWVRLGIRAIRPGPSHRIPPWHGAPQD